MTSLLVAYAVLAVGAAVAAASRSEIVYAEPDFSTIVTTEAGDFLMEAFKAAGNDEIIGERDETRRAELYWASIGQPRLVRAPGTWRGGGSLAKNGVVELGRDRVSVWIGLLTPPLQHELAALAEMKYHWNVSDKQVGFVPLSQVNCSIKLYDDDGKLFALDASVSDVSSNPFRVNFLAFRESPQRKMFDALVASRSGSEVAVECRLRVRTRLAREEPLLLSENAIKRLGVVGRLFGAKETVTVTREQLSLLAEAVHDALGEEVDIPVLEFVDGFIDGILQQIQLKDAMGLRLMDVGEALVLLSPYGGDSSDSATKSRDLNLLLKVKVTGRQKTVTVNYAALADMRQRGVVVEVNGVVVLHRVIRLGALLAMVNGAPTGSMGTLDGQLAALNAFEDCDVKWELRNGDVVATQIRVALLKKQRFRRSLSFLRIPKAAGPVVFSRDVYLETSDVETSSHTWTEYAQQGASGSREVDEESCDAGFKQLVETCTNRMAEVRGELTKTFREVVAAATSPQISPRLRSLERQQLKTRETLNELTDAVFRLNNSQQRMNTMCDASESLLSGTASMPKENMKEWQKMMLPLLFFGSTKGYADLVRRLIVSGADVNMVNVDGRTALHEASRSGNVEVVKLLLKHSSDFSRKDNEGFTPLQYACQNGYAGVVKALAESGVDVNEKKDGWTALQVASWNGRVPVIRELIRLGADVNAKNAFGFFALYDASDNGKMQVVAELLKRGAAVNARIPFGYTALHKASGKGHVDVVKELLQHGADVNARNKDEWTALHEACFYGRAEVVRNLLRSGAHVDAKDNAGSTPLHVAAQTGRTDLVRLLLSNGATVNARDRYGATPLSRAAGDATKKVLVSHGGTG